MHICFASGIFCGKTLKFAWFCILFSFFFTLSFAILLLLRILITLICSPNYCMTYFLSIIVIPNKVQTDQYSCEIEIICSEIVASIKMFIKND